ncbi:hypothetical protein GHT06_022185 [Daphnia sinensis]|uniref:Uncharacterized protein n=1 Tax=Daphnia sinensis TaxID=1820382 RepID=A0AAD5PP88_9CRUS|nr:hypothetical protein GHT06_022185 [Daphnia sinensis]
MPSNEANNIDVLLSGILLKVRLESNCLGGSPAGTRTGGDEVEGAQGETIYSHRSPLDHQRENAIEMHGKMDPPSIVGHNHRPDTITCALTCNQGSKRKEISRRVKKAEEETQSHVFWSRLRRDKQMKICHRDLMN